jgi:hypothetical protein
MQTITKEHFENLLKRSDVTINQYPLILKDITDILIDKTLIATRTLTASTAVQRGPAHIDSDLAMRLTNSKTPGELNDLIDKNGLVYDLIPPNTKGEPRAVFSCGKVLSLNVEALNHEWQTIYTRFQVGSIQTKS